MEILWGSAIVVQLQSDTLCASTNSKILQHPAMTLELGRAVNSSQNSLSKSCLALAFQDQVHDQWGITVAYIICPSYTPGVPVSN